MTPERLEQIQELYHAALERDTAGRAALLADADPELRREVESLLAQNGGVMEKPALDAAHQKGITHRDLKPGNILRGRMDSARGGTGAGNLPGKGSRETLAIGA